MPLTAAERFRLKAAVSAARLREVEREDARIKAARRAYERKYGKERDKNGKYIRRDMRR